MVVLSLYDYALVKIVMESIWALNVIQKAYIIYHLFLFLWIFN